MTIVEKTDKTIAIPVGIGVVQTETTRNFYNTNDSTITSSDVVVDKVAYGKQGKVVGSLDLYAEKQDSYENGYNEGNTDGYNSGFSAGNQVGYENGYSEGKDYGYDQGYHTGYENGYEYGENEGYADGYAEGLDDGIVDGRNEIIEGQSDATITPNNVLKGYIGYGKDNERIVGESEAITSIDVAASEIKFGYSSFSEIPSYYNFDNVTNVSNMFYNCSKLTSVPLFDTSKVTFMGGMFYGCSKLTSVPLFDTSNVTNMNNMFYNCSKLTSVPLFDTSKVTDMNNMFNNCYELTSVPEFDTSKVTIMNNMFNSCQVLITIPPINCSLLTTFPTGYYSAPLYGCKILENFGGFVDLGKNFTGSSKKTFYMGTNNQALTRESMINTFNALYDLHNTTFTGTANFYVSKYPYAKITDDDIAIATSKGWTILEYNG